MKSERKYAVGSDMVLVKTSSPLLEGWEPCDDIRELKAATDKPVGEAIKPGVKWRGNRIPAEQLKKVLGTAARFPHMETGYVLYYNPMSKAWEIRCTTQSGSGGLCKFHDDKPATPGFVEIGTIHTHPNMPAWWSTTDRKDQDGKYGIHCVLGLDEGVAARYKWTIFTPHCEYDQQWEDIAEPVELGRKYEADEEWVKVINEAYRPKEQPSVKLRDPVRSIFDKGMKRWVSQRERSERRSLESLMTDKERTAEMRDRLCDMDADPQLGMSSSEYLEYKREKWKKAYGAEMDEYAARQRKRETWNEAGTDIFGACVGALVAEAVSRGLDMGGVLAASGMFEDYNFRLVDMDSYKSLEEFKEYLDSEFDDRFIMLDREKEDDFEERVAMLLEELVDKWERTGVTGLDYDVSPEMEDALARIGFYRKEVDGCSASTSSAAEESADS